MQKQNYPAALKDLQTAYELDATHPVINNNLGLAYFVRKKYHNALAHFTKAIENKENYTEAKNNLGRTLAELGRYSKALGILKEAEKDLTYQHPEKTYKNIGYTYFLMRKYQNAYDSFVQSLKIDPQNCLLNNYFSKSLYHLNKYKLSISSFQKTITICGENRLEDPYYFSALNYYKIGLFHNARAQIKSLQAKFPEGTSLVKAKKLLEIMK